MSAASAETIPPGVTVFCDPTLEAAMRSLDEVSRNQAGVPVSVLCAPAPLMLAQIQRHTRNDVLFTLSGAMDMAVRSRLVRSETRINGFSNPLVLASLRDRYIDPPDKAALLEKIGSAKLAATDDTVISGLDGRAVLQANGLSKATCDHVLGAANTGDVAFLITSGRADIGLVYSTDVKANRRLQVLATLIADPALTTYAGAVNAMAVSPNAHAFLNVVRSPSGTLALRSAGLEIAL